MPSEWFPIGLAAVVASIGAVVDPALLHPEIQVWPPPFDATRAPSFFLSPWFLACAVPAAVGTRFILNHAAFSKTERTIVVWWWLNLTFFLTICDCFSGLLQVMPNLTPLYMILNKDHKLPRFHPDRAVMDTIYVSEIVTLPFIVYTIYLYFQRSPTRYVWDALLAGFQVCGAVAYYVPDIILGEHTSIITNVDRIIAFSWVIMSTFIFFQALHGIEELSNFPKQFQSVNAAKPKAS